MTEFEKMRAGQIYNPMDPDLYGKYMECHRKIYRYNSLHPDAAEEREELLRLILGSCGKNPRIEAPFHCDYGINIEVGDNFFANYNVVILDVAPVSIGHSVMLAPNVAIYTAAHPLDAGRRNSGNEFAVPVSIGNNVWLGGNVVVVPGVKIGNNSVVGAGSVVTRDLPDNVLAVGNPARILREIGERDRIFFYRDRKYPDQY